MKPQKFSVVLLVIVVIAFASLIFFDKFYNFFKGQKAATDSQNNIPPQVQTEEDSKQLPIKVFSNPSQGYQFSYKAVYNIQPDKDLFNLINNKNKIIATIKVVDSADREAQENLYRESITSQGYSVTLEDHSFSNATAKIFQAAKDGNQTNNLLTLTNPSMNKTILINTVDPLGFANYPDDIYMVAETFGLIE